MPATLSYPGVYVEEIPSGVRTITGVATSITAFIGRARRGPVDDATEIHNFGDFERIFGGLWIGSRLGYAVNDFFRNGGSTAIIVRVFQDPPPPDDNPPAPPPDDGGDGPGPVAAPVAAEPPKPTTASLVVGGGTGLKLSAISPGSWGTYLAAEVNFDNISDDVASSVGLTAGDLFNLVIRDTSPGGSTESFNNVTVKGDSLRRVDTYVAASSRLVTIDALDPDNLPVLTGPDPILDTASAALKTLKDELQALKDTLNALPASASTEERQAAVDAVKAKQLAIDTAIAAQRDTASDGEPLTSSTFTGDRLNKKGLFALEHADLFNLLVIPPYTASEDVEPALLADAEAYCAERRAMLIVDPPSTWTDKSTAVDGFRDDNPPIPRSRNACLFFPRIRETDPLRNNLMTDFAPGGAIAGVFARTDTERGVWKAPAGLDATVKGALALTVVLTDLENGDLNPLGVNCLRSMPAAGRVVWGSRTLRGADALADEYKYISVRRTALYIEESLYRGTQWVVFEPNDEPLWASIRLNVGAFMHSLFRQGAFQGRTPREAYLVKCDKETTTQDDINRGVVNIVVGFAPLKPAEFVVIQLQQLAGQIEV